MSIACVAGLAIAGCGGDADVRALVSEREGFEFERCTELGFAVVVGEREEIHRCSAMIEGKRWYSCYAVIDGKPYRVMEQARDLGCLVISD